MHMIDLYLRYLDGSVLPVYLKVFNCFIFEVHADGLPIEAKPNKLSAGEKTHSPMESGQKITTLVQGIQTHKSCLTSKRK